jgi:septal ring factor EnvC (AmiA/AmiB activator)
MPLDEQETHNEIFVSEQHIAELKKERAQYRARMAKLASEIQRTRMYVYRLKRKLKATA